jgi:catechol 2,3-dioxygenase-like lactoylglutathione lyase family enzyme
MEQRVSLITLGVRELERTRRFYEALGWSTGAAPSDDVVFFQTGGFIVALWDRAKLAEDSGVQDDGMLGGRHARLQREVTERGRRDHRGSSESRSDDRSGAGYHVLGRIFRGVRRSGRSPLGGRSQPRLEAARGRDDHPPIGAIGAYSRDVGHLAHRLRRRSRPRTPGLLRRVCANVEKRSV